MSSQKYLNEIHKENQDWIKSLGFSEDELKSFENRLSEVVSKNTKSEVLARAEHFQNQFIRHHEVIDILKHDINAFEQTIVENAKQNNVATDHRKTDVNEDLTQRMSAFTKIWEELKDDYKKYLAEVL